MLLQLLPADLANTLPDDEDVVNELSPVPDSAMPPSALAVYDAVMATSTKEHEVFLYPIAMVPVYTVYGITAATAFQFLSTYLAYSVTTLEDVAGKLLPVVAVALFLYPPAPL